MSANLATLLWTAADRAPDQLAVFTRETTTTYATLRNRAGAIAAYLQTKHFVPGERIALLVERSAEAIAGLCGIHAAGLVAVPINERLRARQIEHQISHCSARALLTTPGTLERLPRTPDSEAQILDLHAIPSNPARDLVPRAAGDLAQIIYTSGSTGLPKGVAFTHGALQAGVATVNAYLGQTQSDRVASLLALSTVYGLNQVLTAISCGAALVVETSPLATEALITLRQRAATVVAAVPPLWLQLLGTGRFDSHSLPSVRILQNAGGRLPTETVRRIRAAFPDAQLFLQYGQTETFRGTFLPPSETDRRPDSMGKAIPGADLLVLREDGSRAAPGEIGELVHAGPTIASGYWNDAAATNRVFRPHPDPARAARGERVVFSGDLVRQDAEGYFTFVSRADRLIKTMGFRVGPDEVADVLYASGEILEAVVSGEPDPDRGERIVAFVILKPAGDLKRLTRFTRSELPLYMVPAQISAVNELPRLASGKYDLAAIKGARSDHGTY
jgi:acyl-CoA synthetase (AMP-forming)/AMP-acid ligase II